MTVMNDTSCFCPNCKTDLKKLRYTQVQAHLYIDNFVYPELSEYVKDQKAKRKLNKTLLDALLLYKDSPSFDIDAFKKSLSRIESVLDISSDKAMVSTLKNELVLLKSFL